MSRSYRLVGVNSKRNSYRNQELERIEDQEIQELMEEAQNLSQEEYVYE